MSSSWNPNDSELTVFMQVKPMIIWAFILISWCVMAYIALFGDNVAVTCYIVRVISMALIFYCGVCKTGVVKYSDNVLEFLKITHELGERTFSLRTTLSFTNDCVVRLTGCNGCGKTQRQLTTQLVPARWEMMSMLS